MKMTEMGKERGERERKEVRLKRESQCEIEKGRERIWLMGKTNEEM